MQGAVGGAADDAGFFVWFQPQHGLAVTQQEQLAWRAGRRGGGGEFGTRRGAGGGVAPFQGPDAVGADALERALAVAHGVGAQLRWQGLHRFLGEEDLAGRVLGQLVQARGDVDGLPQRHRVPHGLAQLDHARVQAGIELQAGQLRQPLRVDGGLCRRRDAIPLEHRQDIIAVGFDEDAAARAGACDDAVEQVLDAAAGGGIAEFRTHGDGAGDVDDQHRAVAGLKWAIGGRSGQSHPLCRGAAP